MDFRATIPEDPWKSMEAHRLQGITWKPMEFYGILLDFIEIHGSPRISIEFHGIFGNL